MYHIPLHSSPGSIPLALPDCLVSFYYNKIFCCSQFTVSVRYSYTNFAILRPSSCRFFKQCKSFRKNFSQYFFFLLVCNFIKICYLPIKCFFLVNIFSCLDFALDILYLLTHICCSILNFLLKFSGLFSKSIIGKFSNSWLSFFYLLYYFFYFLQVFLVFVT